ncbi:cation-translocating P-type ATPase [Candidatus Bathyarchaeota archaeon]|nr:cation-translocating P-type ATPase [Candidatus Bathyarchaeota archaeon]MCK4482007.1 cation-translocating P-type ATPase [Candidatus Bathyarchaeota archaeon]
MSKPWHSMEIKEVMHALNVTMNGLSSEEVQRRLEEFGPNELKKEKRKSPFKLFLEQFTDVLIIILLAATVLSFAVGEPYDAMVIIAIVIACAVLGFTQEYKAEKAIEALKKMTAPTATVLRDGKEVELETSDIVPGDIILLYTGDKVPADARLIEAINTKTDEAPLTGESTPVNKNVKPLPEETIVSDRRNTVFTGTVVVYGRGKALVTSTGMNTEFGKIAKMVQVTKEEETPLEKRMAHVGKWLGMFCVAVCLFVAGLGIMRGYEFLDMILWGISLAVAAVPEALPAVVTGALAIGMYRMAKENSIVRRLPAVETLGCTSVICSDKTGTLTKGEMTVQRIYINDKALKVTGVGYDPKGDFLFEDKKLDPTKEKEIYTLLKAATLCNDAKLGKVEGRWAVKGDPTEGALVVVAAKASLWKEEIEKEEPRMSEIPFSSERKRMTTAHKVHGDGKIAYMKGAPEIVLEKCKEVYTNGKVRKLTDEKRKQILAVNEAMAIQALRNLGFAYKELPKSTDSLDEEDENDFVFLGIMGMIDPPREEVKDAIHMCNKAGIKVVMVTGDHKLTAVAVAKALNLVGEKEGEDGKVLTGVELDKIGDEEFGKMVEDLAIYARVSPEHKVRIVKALRAKGYVCAMTGDGVNDAPALKMADIGIAMGITGTEVTKEASDMVLTDDNFATIVRAVKEGREVYENIKKYLTFLLQCNIMEILVLFIAMMLSPELESALALTTIQILWVNLTTDGLPAIALGVDPGDPDLMEKKPRDPKASVFTRNVKIYLIAVPTLTTALMLIAYFYYEPWLGGNNLIEARTQLFTSIILVELAIAITARSLRYTVFKVGVFKNKFLWLAILSSLGLQLIVLYTPQLHSVFDVTYPDLFDWIVAIAFTLITFFSIEIGKFITSRRSES